MSEIKSIGAKEYIENVGSDSNIVYQCEAMTAIKLAESDARDRAVRAFRYSCPRYDDGRELCWNDATNVSRKCEFQCTIGKEFLKAYDNE